MTPSPSIFRSPGGEDSQQQHRRSNTHDTADLGNLSFDHEHHAHEGVSVGGGPHHEHGGTTSPLGSGSGSPSATKVLSHDPIPCENSTDESVQHTSILIRLMHHRPTQVKAVIVLLATVGLAVGLGYGLGGAAASSSAASSGSSHGQGGGSSSGMDRDRPESKDDLLPTTDEPQPSSPPDEWDDGHTKVTASAEPDWFPTMHLEGTDDLTTVGSTLSFSADGTRLAVSSRASDSVRILKVNANGRWRQVGDDLPGKTASLSGDGTRVAVADATTSTVTTYELDGTAQWNLYGSVLTDLWGARDVSLDSEGTNLAVSHAPDPLCRICPSVATVYQLDGSEERWHLSSDILGAYDFDFSVDLSSDGNTLGFSGRVYDHVPGMEMQSVSEYDGGNWDVMSDFPDFISGATALSADGRTAAVSLPDCHVFKSTDPSEPDCTNTDPREVSVLEYRDDDGGWWNRKGLSVGPKVDGPLGTTGLSLSADGNTVAVAVGARGQGGELDVGGAAPPTQDLNDSGPLRRRLEGKTAAKKTHEKHHNKNHEARRTMTDEDLDLTSTHDAYATDEAYVRVYRYDPAEGTWSTIGPTITLDASGSTVALSGDGGRLAVGVPYGGEESKGYVKVYDLVH